MSSRDYTSKTLYTIIITTVIMLGIMFIPGYSFGKISIRRANIANEIIHFNDAVEGTSGADEEFIQSLDTTFLDELPNDIKDEISTEINQHPSRTQTFSQHSYDSSYIHIEDFSHDSMMYKFYKSVYFESKQKTVRIGVCGDSFIEADILTSDLREMLQDKYGGQGVGFVPVSHPLLKYRTTISSSAVGWTDYSAMKRKNIPEELNKSMYISGCFSVPSENNARSYFKGNTSRKFINNAQRAVICFSSSASNQLNVCINDTSEVSYQIIPSPDIQFIEIERNDISSLSFTIKEKENFIGYGVFFDGRHGVAVDNYSIRGNSGVCLFYSNKDVNRQIDNRIGYNLIILQYGLNIMSDDVTDYSSYKEQLKKIIAYIKLCFPKSAIIVMSISDRGKNDNGEIRSMNGIPYLIAQQRQAAIETGVAFWNTFDAMGGSKSIVNFAQKGWAGKDYTHINYKGGKYIAEKLFNSIVSEIENSDVNNDIEYRTIEPVKRSLPEKVESKNEKTIRIISEYDNSKHKLVSRKYGKKIKKW